MKVVVEDKHKDFEPGPTHTRLAVSTRTIMSFPLSMNRRFRTNRLWDIIGETLSYRPICRPIAPRITVSQPVLDMPQYVDL